MFTRKCFVHRQNLKKLTPINLNKNASERNYNTNNDIIYSKVPDVHIPRNLIHEYVWCNLDKWPDKTALVCGETGRKYTFSQVYLKSKSLAIFLRNSLKLQQGDTVAIVMPNVPEYIIIILGALTGGLKITPINPMFQPEEIAKQLSDSKAKLIFTLNDLYEVMEKATNVICKDKMPFITVNHRQFQSTPNGAINLDEICNKDVNDINLNVNIDCDDIAILPYSSGTTGKPKGVELTHYSIMSNLFQMKDPMFKLNEDTNEHHQDVIPCVLPLFHIYGLICIVLNVFPLGCKVVTLSKFSSANFIKLLEEHYPHVLYLVPPIILMLLNNVNIKRSHLNSVRTVMSSAAPLGAADIERFFDKTKGEIDFLQMYGMTEASPLLLCQTKRTIGGVKIGGSGLLLSNTKAKIVDVNDPNNNNLGLKKSGELIIKGPQIMKGYHNNKESTKTTIVDDGWLRTGDIGHYDEDGQFYITDRLKELIKVKGFQVAPAELEEILRSHPHVADAAVIGVNHSAYGEVPKAFVVIKSSNVKPNNLEEYVASKVAPYKKLIGGVTLVDAIPKTASGKILRRELKHL